MTSSDATAALHHALEHARHLLPDQAPLESFVHHNTLHAFEHLPFHDAVEQAALLYGTEPYPSAEELAEHLETGRIATQDVDAEIAAIEGLDETLWRLGPTRRALWRALLFEIGEAPGPETMAWLYAEGRLPGARRAHVGRWTQARRAALWEALARVAPTVSIAPRQVRLRDVLLHRYGEDIDQRVHPVLIRVAAAYLDQGLSYWRMPGAEGTFWEAFVGLYARPVGPPDAWMRGLSERLVADREQGLDAQQVVVAALDRLGVGPERYEAFVTDTLLALRGWAGMMQHLEKRPDRAPVSAPHVRLVDYLAVQLVLEEVAAKDVLRRHSDEGEIATAFKEARPRLGRDEAHLYDAFVVAQHLEIERIVEVPGHARTLLEEVAKLPPVKRRRLMHKAYERRHRRSVLDALASAASNPAEAPEPYAQGVFCIDDREESIRRHLEEVDPEIETLGYAGFFGIPMAYQGVEDIRPRPLCPVSIRPQHLIVEQASDVEAAHTTVRKRRVWRSMFVGSRTLLRGTVFAGIVGVASVVPLLLRVLFPRAFSRLRGATQSAAPNTRLVVKSTGEHRETHLGTLKVGFTVEEQADIVQSVLTDMGIHDRLCSLVVMVGHGSSSLNNPHEAAYNCGATGGGRGGSNARAFAQMANDPQVRELLMQKGLQIPDDTYFVGAYHNTCDDAVDFYDLDLVPVAARERLEAFRGSMDDARRRDAAERVRRFEMDPLEGSDEAMLAVAEAHAVDLAQPRPEYGHSTNALCFVGPRTSTLGVFLDRRAFLVSYEPSKDPDGAVLAGLLASVGPVGAGINLEYYFSRVDNAGYGCGTKLPHNVSGLIGVMDGHASDLRTGLNWQMVEIHEPLRLLNIIEAEPETLVGILEGDAGLKRLVVNGWIQVVAWSPSTRRLFVFTDGEFVEHEAPHVEVYPHPSSAAVFRGRRDNIEPTLVGRKEVRRAS